MDIPKNCIAKRTRFQRQKAEMKLLEIARILKEEKGKGKKSVKTSSENPMPRSPIDEASDIDIEELGEKCIPAEQRRQLSDNGKNSVQKDSEIPIPRSSRDEASGSDIEERGEKYIPPQERRPLPESRISKQHQNIVIDQTLVPSLGHDSEAANQNQGAQHIGAPSRSNSVSTSSEDFSDDGVICQGKEYDDNHCKEVENHYEMEIGNTSLLNLDSSSEEGNCDSGQSDSQGDENLNQGKKFEISESTSESSNEEGNCESDDDYNGVEFMNSESESLTESESHDYCRTSDLAGGLEKDDSISSTAKRNPAGKNVEHEEDERRVRKRTMNNGGEDDDCSSTLKEMNLVTKKRKSGDVHEESGKKRRVLGLAMWVDGSRRNEEVRKSRVERLRPRQVPQSVKAKLEFGKPSYPVRLSDNDANESTDANEPLDASDRDHFVQKSSRKSRITQKKSVRKNCQSKYVDILNILADSIWEKGDALKEKLPPLEEKDYSEKALPLKFRFEDEDPALLEKGEETPEVEKLFADLEMGWTEEDIGSTKLSKEDIDAAAAATAATKVSDPVERCWFGHHFLILDETIGVVCKYCGFVETEMKYLFPDLKMPTRRRSEWFDFYSNESSHSFEFQFCVSASIDHHAFIGTEGSILNRIPVYLRRQMYPHQLDGFQFLWKKIANVTTVEDLRTPLANGGTGCIISHAPGTGKTFLTIVFLLTFMEVHPTSRPVIMAPVSMLQAWANELKRWKVNIPFHNLQDAELSGDENVMASRIFQLMGSSAHKKQDKDYKRMVKLYSWTKGRSILGIGYKLFGKLAGEHRKGKLAEKFRNILLDMPGILILDEGHTARNENSCLWKALAKVQTSRQIILSGTPFQNNTDELYNILCLVNPKFAESISLKTGRSYAKWKSNPAKGRWASLTSLIDANDDDAVEELRAMMAPFVHVHKGNILQESLPGLRDTLVVLKPTDLQKQLLQRILDNVLKEKKIHNVLEMDQKEKFNFLEKVHLVSLVSVHPSLVAQHDQFSEHKTVLENLETSPEAGVKTQFVIEIVRLSKARNEKVLIFSEFIDPLNFLLKQLTSFFSWEEGKEVLYMDGKLGDKQRQLVINSLNAHNSAAKVLLASIKASGEGINLVGASRVVLLDVVWNPSVERQAICRAYRLGQKKLVYVYRLIMSGMEIYKYKGQAKKDRLSELLFPPPEGQNHESSTKLPGSISDDDILNAMVHHKNLSHIFETILPQPKESNVFENFDVVSSVNSQCLS